MDILNSKKSFSLNQQQPQVYRNLVVEGVLLLIAIGLLLNFLVLPKRKAVADQAVKIESLTTENNNIEKNKQELNSLIQQMKASKKDIAVLDSTLPLNSRITTTHVLLDSLISSSGLTLASLSTDTADDLIAAGDENAIKDPYAGKRQIRVVSVTLGVTGTMDQFLIFLKSLESSARLVDVKSITINNAKNKNASFVLNLKTYYYGLAYSTTTATGEVPPAQ